MVRVTLALAIWLAACGAGEPSAASLAILTSEYAEAPPEGHALEAVALVDHMGVAFDETRLAGRWSLVFVGYTSCPDVCPTTLAALGPALSELADDGVQGVFIAVDPERDRARLPELVEFHGGRLLGVTGEPAAIDAVVAQLGAAYTRRDGGLIDHSTPLFLVDPTGHVAGYVLRPSAAARIVRVTRTAIAAGPRGPSLARGWVRAGPTDATVLAGFGTLVNPTGEAVTVTGSSGTDFGATHLHETVESGGVARMRGVSGLTVPAGGRASLEPGGHHLMLMEPGRALGVGDETVLRLDLASGDHVLARLRVRPR